MAVKFYTDKSIVDTLCSKAIAEHRIITFTCDFAACGYASPEEQSRVLISIFQKLFFEYVNPIIYLGVDAFICMQRHRMVPGFLFKTEDIVYVGDLSTNNTVIQVSSKVTECSSCGNREPSIRGICGKCSNSYHSTYGSTTVPLYCFPKYQGSHYSVNSSIIIAEKEIDNPRMITLTDLG